MIAYFCRIQSCLCAYAIQLRGTISTCKTTHPRLNQSDGQKSTSRFDQKIDSIRESTSNSKITKELWFNNDPVVIVKYMKMIFDAGSPAGPTIVIFFTFLHLFSFCYHSISLNLLSNKFDVSLANIKGKFTILSKNQLL